MKSQADLVKSWLRKAESDLANAQLCLGANTALDTVCFHAQQAAEKCLKAFLSAHKISFPPLHNLEKLVELCLKNDPAFAKLKMAAQNLTPYAVESRYDDDFWPSLETANEAVRFTIDIRDFVLERLPKEPRPESKP